MRATAPGLVNKEGPSYLAVSIQNMTLKHGTYKSYLYWESVTMLYEYKSKGNKENYFILNAI